MIKFFSRLPIRVKFVGSCVFILTLTSLFIFSYYPCEQKRQIYGAMERTDENMASMIALGIGIGMGSDDFTAITESLNWAKQDSNLAYVVVLDENNEIFTLFNPHRLKLDIPALLGQDDTQGRMIEVEGYTLHTARVAIEYAGVNYGTLLLASSMDAVKQAISRSMVTTLKVCLAILFVGVVISLYLSHMITKPLMQLKDAAGQVARGNYEVKFPVNASDEVGEVWQAFHDMIENVRQTTKSLRESKEEYLSIFETAASLITSINGEGIIVDCNSQIRQLLGYEPDAVIGQSISRIVHPNDLGRARNDLETTTNQGFLYGHEYRMVKKDGTTIDVSANWSCLKNEEGEFVRAVCVIDVISERKWAEDRIAKQNEMLKNTIESLNHPFYVIDANEYTIEMANSAAGFGDLSARPTCYALSHKRDKPCLGEAYPCPLQQVKKTKEPVVIERNCYDKNGNNMTVEIHGYPIFDDQGNVIQMIEYSLDITEKKQAEEALKTFARELERSNRELDDFASIASHDLQEPLRKVLAFGDRLKAICADALTDKGQDYLRRMQDAARRMQALIVDLLTYSRVMSKVQPFIPVDLGQIAREVLSDLEVRIEQLGGQIDIGQLQTIEADPLQMRQLLQNLIGNALKFNRPHETPVVKVYSRLTGDLSQQAIGGNSFAEHCQIMVEDNGIGFDEKYLDRIFGVFQRLHGKGEYEGTGIGLAVCNKIARRHGGSITAKSTLGQGATFIVTLPIKQQKGETKDGRARKTDSYFVGR